VTYTPLLPSDRSVFRGANVQKLNPQLSTLMTHVRESFHSAFCKGEETHMLIPFHPRCRGPPGEALEAGGSEPSFHESLTS
jgi:hypothetical protein